MDELTFTRETLDGRYEDLEGGKVKPVPRDEVFARLRAKSAARRAQSKALRRCFSCDENFGAMLLSSGDCCQWLTFQVLNRVDDQKLAQPLLDPEHCMRAVSNGESETRQTQ